MKKGFVYFFVFLLAIAFISGSVLAQTEAIPEGIEEDAAGILNKTGRVREIVEQKQWEYVNDYWQGVFLNNSVVQRYDSAFKKANPIFVFLFAQDYKFSATLFIVVLLWIITLISLNGYFTAFFENKNYKILATIAATVVLAHIQVFNFIAKGLFTFSQIVLLGRQGGLWSTASFILVVVAVFFLFYVNRIFSEKVRKSAEEGKKKALEAKVEGHEKFVEGASEGL